MNGVTYTPNIVFGAGTNIGDAVVLWNGESTGDGATQSIEVAGLSLTRGQSYDVYVFSYNGEKGEESYLLRSNQKNPATLYANPNSSLDDDIVFGGRPNSNDTYYESVTVCTNAPIAGMLYPIGETDCFNFMVTSAAPNVRVLLTNISGNYESSLPGNYTIELWDFTNRRIRRSTLNGTVSEALVVNDLPPGTYVVKVFSADGSG